MLLFYCDIMLSDPRPTRSSVNGRDSQSTAPPPPPLPALQSTRGAVPYVWVPKGTVKEQFVDRSVIQTNCDILVLSYRMESVRGHAAFTKTTSAQNAFVDPVTAETTHKATLTKKKLRCGARGVRARARARHTKNKRRLCWRTTGTSGHERAGWGSSKKRTRRKQMNDKPAQSSCVCGQQQQKRTFLTRVQRSNLLTKHIFGWLGGGTEGSAGARDCPKPTQP